ncbi:hypothetical protein Hanom_Chr04g00356461 [Helianthus anomalus]
MRPGLDAHISIIQCWACIVSYEERNKALEYPSRTLFCCLKCGTLILQNRPTYDETTKVSYRHKEFNRNMATVLKNACFKEDTKDRYIEDYELVFVLITWARHFYVICFNIKHSRVDVLDNNVVEDYLSIKGKYVGWMGMLVSILKTLYIETILTKCHTNVCKECEIAAQCFYKLLAS